LLALAFERALGREDLLRQVLRCIRFRRLEPCIGGRDRSSQRRPTAPTELLAAFVPEPTGRAGKGQCRAAFSAEAAIRAVLGVTARTLHPESSRASTL